jgi:hypothetical protein
VPSIEEVVTDKDYHSGEVLVMMQGAEVRTYIPEKKQKGQRHWEGRHDQQQAVYANRRCVNGAYGKRLLRSRTCAYPGIVSKKLRNSERIFGPDCHFAGHIIPSGRNLSSIEFVAS